MWPGDNWNMGSSRKKVQPTTLTIKFVPSGLPVHPIWRHVSNIYGQTWKTTHVKIIHPPSKKLKISHARSIGYFWTVINPMERSPSYEVNSSLTSQEISHHFIVAEDLLPRSQDSAIGPYPESENSSPRPRNRFKIYFNIILPTTPRSFKGSLSLHLPQQNPACTSPLPTRVPCPAHLSFPSFITQNKFGEKYKPWSSPQCAIFTLNWRASINLMLNTANQ